MKRLGYIGYILVVLMGSFLLLTTMFVTDKDILGQLKKEIAQSEESLAVNLDSYLSKNFGFREELISLYTRIQTSIFKTSPVENVIYGENGYLFYKETADDYCKTNPMSERELFNLSKTLELMQEYVVAQDGTFVLLVAPNKNSLYDYMPYNYAKIDAPSNWDRLEEKLASVNYVDAFAIFESSKEELYYKTDSHWNDLGAYYVFEETMKVLGKEHVNRLESGYEEACTMVGDLQRMLYPIAKLNENQIIWNVESTYEFLTNTRNFEQVYIETNCEAAQGSLLMFRDSFANNLIDHFGNVYEYGIFDKESAYNFFQMNTYQADTVILEIAERNLVLIQESTPKFYAPERVEKDIFTDKANEESVKGLADYLEWEKTEEGIFVKGYLNQEYADVSTCFYVKVDGMLYELTPQTIQENEYGFCGYLKEWKEDASIELVVVSGNQMFTETIEVEIK